MRKHNKLKPYGGNPSPDAEAYVLRMVRFVGVRRIQPGLAFGPPRGCGGRRRRAGVFDHP